MSDDSIVMATIAGLGLGYIYYLRNKSREPRPFDPYRDYWKTRGFTPRRVVDRRGGETVVTRRVSKPFDPYRDYWRGRGLTPRRVVDRREDEVIEDEVIEDEVIEQREDEVIDRREDEVIEQREDGSGYRPSKVTLERSQYEAIMEKINRTTATPPMIGEEKVEEKVEEDATSAVIRRDVPIGPSTGMAIWEGVKYSTTPLVWGKDLAVYTGKGILDGGKYVGDYITDGLYNATSWVFWKSFNKTIEYSPGLAKTGWEYTKKGGSKGVDLFLQVIQSTKEYMEWMRQQNAIVERDEEVAEEKRREEERLAEEKRRELILADKKQWLDEVEKVRTGSISKYIEYLLEMRRNNMALTENELRVLDSYAKYYWEYKRSVNIDGSIDDHILYRANEAVGSMSYNYLFPPMDVGGRTRVGLSRKFATRDDSHDDEYEEINPLDLTEYLPSRILRRNLPSLPSLPSIRGSDWFRKKSEQEERESELRRLEIKEEFEEREEDVLKEYWDYIWGSKEEK